MVRKGGVSWTVIVLLSVLAGAAGIAAAQEKVLLKRTVFGNVAYGLRVRSDLARFEARVHEALSWVGLNGREFAERPWYALSGGEAQRVALASRLILKPAALLLDEPTANVDALSTQLIKEAALRARQELQRLGIYPGCRVEVDYDPARITWVQS